MRYALLSFFDKLRGKQHKRCVYCGRKLTESEIKYYEHSCNKCEGKLMKKWERG